MRIVLDATVLVRAHPRSSSVGKKLLEALIAGGHTLLLSGPLVAETIKVLRYPRLQRLHAMTEEQMYQYAQFLQAVSETVILRSPYHAPLRDANDLDVMQTAEYGEADVICTHDRDFHETGIIAYCASRGIEVCRETTLLTRLAEKTS